VTSAPRATSGALRAAGARWSLLIVREIDLGAQRFTSNQRRADARGTGLSNGCALSRRSASSSESGAPAA